MVEVVSARISTIAHATEDQGKVVQALESVFPPELGLRNPDKRRVKGHYGNEITTITLGVRGRSARSLFGHILKKLPTADRATLAREFESRLDDAGRLHMRLDKQACLLGEIRLGEQDPIKLELVLKETRTLGSDTHEKVGSLIESYPSV